MYFVLNSGGIGDALIGCAECYKLRDKTPLMIHAANRHNAELIQAFVEPFGIPALVLDGSFLSEQKAVWQALHTHPQCTSCCHLPDHLDHGEWANRLKYEPRVATVLPVQELFGKGEPCIVIAPSGSGLPATIGKMQKQRHLLQEEFSQLIAKHVFNGPVYVICSEEQMQLYGPVRHENCYWLQHDCIIHNDIVMPSTVANMYKIINGATAVYSMDTWVKTYSLYAGVPTVVIRTRFDGQYVLGLDSSENIFLNRRLWPAIQIRTIEELLA